MADIGAGLYKTMVCNKTNMEIMWRCVEILNINIII